MAKKYMGLMDNIFKQGATESNQRERISKEKFKELGLKGVWINNLDIKEYGLIPITEEGGSIDCEKEDCNGHEGYTSPEFGGVFYEMGDCKEYIELEKDKTSKKQPWDEIKIETVIE